MGFCTEQKNLTSISDLRRSPYVDAKIPMPIKKVGPPAHVGLITPVHVVVPPGNTGLHQSQTSFFQVLNILIKINKGSVEINIPVDIIKSGEKVGSLESALLSKLGIRPFSYGFVVGSVYNNGYVFCREVLNLANEELMVKFSTDVCNIESLCLVIVYPTLAAAPNMFINAYKNLLAVAVETEYSFPHVDNVKEYLKVREPARVGLIATLDVVVPPGNRVVDLSQTSFQVLNIHTKFNKGTVEIIIPVQLIKAGQNDASSASDLLSKLGIKPFSYGLVVVSVYDNGSVFSPEVLNPTNKDLIAKFSAGVCNVASLSLATTLAAAHHMFINAYNNLLAVAVQTKYSLLQADKVIKYLKVPSGNETKRKRKIILPSYFRYRSYPHYRRRCKNVATKTLQYPNIKQDPWIYARRALINLFKYLLGIGSKNKLQNLAGEHSDILETLSPNVRKRVEFLQEIQVCFRLGQVVTLWFL